ncbi:hypothetical protein GSH19_03645 [Lactobacillus sp. S2-2]|uniref:hypothetical protein n=1 Tax=Lactobacillus sp. S2-2 TaxID=2692917 RepID=UPI001F2C7BE4|nr:hypothetical protein [Lactobacillus sp. S2-2]MCF6515246.1 hypothetical protein [Lactobacillus sp. S2-2]
MNRMVKLGLSTIAVSLGLTLFATGTNNVKADSSVDIPNINKNVEQKTYGNVMSNYNDSDIKDVTTNAPSGNKTKKYDKSELVDGINNPGHVFNTTSNSTQSNSFKTAFYLPDGFNVFETEHGNYQSVVMTGDSIYFLESMGTGKNLGAIVKYKLSDLKALGIDGSSNYDDIWKAVNWFNPYTDEGYVNNKKYLDVTNNLPTDEYYAAKKAVTNATTKLEKSTASQKNANKWLKHWQAKTKYKKYKTNASYKNQVNRKINSWKSKATKYSRYSNNYKKQIKSQNKLVDKYGKKIDAARKANPTMFKYADIFQAAQLSPLMGIGHGQTLSFNPKNQHLYLVQDDSMGDIKANEYNKVLELDPTTMQPIRQYNFQMKHGNTNMQLHTLTFDKDGNAYWGRKSGNGYQWFMGTIDDTNGVSFEPSKQKMATRGGVFNQSVAYNAKNNRVYFVSDDILTSLPVDQLRKGNLKESSFNHLEFDSQREFEGITFDPEGFGYLLTLWPSEVLKSTQPVD